MSKSACSTAVLLAALVLVPGPVSAADASTYTLQNGLQVTLKPLATGDKVALVIVYDLGEDHDPEGRSGLAHLVEHCYVTSAAGETKQRTAEEFMARYPNAWNAQTGMRYTVIATMFTKAGLASELEDAAARMGALEITQADLEREVPRMRDELAQMHDSFSPLAASNRAWMQVRPGPAGSRKGGVIEQIEALSLADVKAWHAKHYKPVNARLVLLGPYDEANGKALIEKHFGPIAKGEKPTPREAGSTKAQPLAEAGRRGGWVARAWQAPASDSEAYAPFLTLARRLMRRNMQRSAATMAPMVQFAPLDAPEVLTILRRIAPEESTAKASAAIDAWLQEIADEPLAVQEGLFTAREFAFLLGTMQIPDSRLAANPYGPAFGLARRQQLGLDGGVLAKKLASVNAAGFEAMFEEVFGEGTGAGAAVIDPHPAR